MNIQDAILSLIGTIFSGIFATIITLVVNHKYEIRRQKKELAAEVFGLRGYV